MSQTVKTPPAAAPSESSNRVTLGLSNRLLARPEVGALVAAIVIFIFFLIVAPSFRSAPSFFTVLYQASTIGIVAVAVGMLMIGGEFDLSAGVLVTSAVLFNSMFCYQLGINLWVGALLSLILCLGIGFLNGYLVMRTGIPSFLITLGTFFILQGANLGVTKLVTGSVSVTEHQSDGRLCVAELHLRAHVPDRRGPVEHHRVSGGWLFAVLSAYILQRTRIGNWIYAVGGNAASARAVGVPVTRVKIGLFMTVGFLGWFTGMHVLYNFNVVQAGNGLGNEFIYIIAAVVGWHLDDRRLRQLHRRRDRCLHLRHDQPVHRLRGLGSQLVQGLPRRDAAARGDREPVHQEALHDPKGGLVMTDTLQEHADPNLHKGESLVQMKDVGKTYGAIRALKGINLTVNAGEVTCVLGDNGAGKSTLIKIISGLHPHNEGELLVDGAPVSFSSPRESLSHGIATVYQDLAVVGLMEVWRNFFLGSEMTGSKFPLSGLKTKEMKRIADEELRKMGIVVKDINQPIGTLSGGQRQCVAIARAVYFGARVLILDEPTAALGVKQSGVVLKYTAAARDAGLGVVFITHNPHHAYLVGNHFIILKLGPGRPRQEARRSEPRRTDPSDGRRRRAHRTQPRAPALKPFGQTTSVARGTGAGIVRAGAGEGAFVAFTGRSARPQ